MPVSALSTNKPMTLYEFNTSADSSEHKLCALVPPDTRMTLACLSDTMRACVLNLSRMIHEKSGKNAQFYRAPFPKETLSLFEQTRGRPRFIFHVALAVIKAVARNAGFRNATSWLPAPQTEYVVHVFSATCPVRALLQHSTLAENHMSRSRKAVTDSVLHEQTHCVRCIVPNHQPTHLLR